MESDRNPGDGYIRVWNITTMEYPVIACFGDRLTPATQRTKVTEALTP